MQQGLRALCRQPWQMQRLQQQKKLSHSVKHVQFASCSEQNLHPRHVAPCIKMPAALIVILCHPTEEVLTLALAACCVEWQPRLDSDRMQICPKSGGLAHDPLQLGYLRLLDMSAFQLQKSAARLAGSKTATGTLLEAPRRKRKQTKRITQLQPTPPLTQVCC